MTYPSNSWLQRWSQRKAEVRGQENRPSAEVCIGRRSGPRTANAASDCQPKEADIGLLDASSDYSRFLLPDVSPQLRTKALRRLWSCHPTLSLPDKLVDYRGDYKISPPAAGVALTTAYRIATGLPSDHEDDLRAVPSSEEEEVDD